MSRVGYDPARFLSRSVTFTVAPLGTVRSRCLVLEEVVENSYVP